MVARPLALQRAEDGEGKWSEALRAHHEILRLTAMAAEAGMVEETSTTQPSDDLDLFSTERSLSYQGSRHLGVDAWEYDKEVQGQRERLADMARLRKQEEEAAVTDSTSGSNKHSLSHSSARSSSTAAARVPKSAPMRPPPKRVLPVSTRTTSPAYRRLPRVLSPGSRLYTDPHSHTSSTLVPRARERDCPPEKWGPLGEQQQRQRDISACKGRDIFPTSAERAAKPRGVRDGGGKGGASTSRAGGSQQRLPPYTPPSTCRSASPASSRTFRSPTTHGQSGTFKKSHYFAVVTQSELAARQALVWAEDSQRQWFRTVFDSTRPSEITLIRPPVSRPHVSDCEGKAGLAISDEDRESLSMHLMQLYDSITHTKHA